MCHNNIIIINIQQSTLDLLGQTSNASVGQDIQLFILQNNTFKNLKLQP